MRIEVLGALAVRGDSRAVGPRDRVVLAALVSRLGEALSPEQLADALWGDEPPASWPKVVQGCMVRLRKVLGPDAIETVGHSYRLSVPASDVDAARFGRAVSRVRELLALDEPDRAAYVADEALGWWRGRPLVELDGWEPGRIEAERLEELRRDLEELRLDALLRSGRYAEVLAAAPARVAEAPLRERRWTLLASAQYQAGRQGEALSTLRRARAALAEGLGIDPGPELAMLEQRILRQDPGLDPAGPPAGASNVCPYLGLVPYGEEDADRFFGRQRDVAVCLEGLARSGVLAVVGASGSGKSSLVRAGVAASLRHEGKRMTVITPGAHPMDALTALPPSGPMPVLVVDQCEEAVTLCSDAAEQARFFAALAAHAEVAPLVLALRADRLGEMSVHPAFAALLERGLHLLTPMGEAELRDAIEGPAHQAGLLLEAGLVDLLVREIEGEPGALPLLSHALRQTWLAREGRTLTVAGYHASGGIRGAVAQSAEEVYERTPEERRPLLRDLLLRLVIPSLEGEPVRRRVPRRMIGDDAAHQQLIELLVAARLITSDEESVELVHEALTRAWPRLRAWLDDDVEGQRILRHLAMTADSWEAMGGPDSELYRGARLAKALAWREATHPDLTTAERAFLDASDARASAEEQAVRRRRRTLVSVLAGATVVASAFGAIAIVQAGLASGERDRALTAEGRAEAEAARAESEAERAEGAAGLARGRELVAQSVVVLETDPTLAKLLSLAAHDVTDEHTLEQLSVLHRAYAIDPVIARYTWPGDDSSVQLVTDLHPDGERMLVAGGVAGPTHALEMYDFERGESVWTWEVDDEELGVVQARFTPDGEQAVAGVVWMPGDEADARTPPLDPLLRRQADGFVRDLVGIHVRAAETGELEEIIDVGRCGGWVEGVTEAHLSVVKVDVPDCDVHAPRTVLLVDRATGEEQLLSTTSLFRAPLSGDGRSVAFTEDPPPNIVVVDVDSGERLAEIDPRAPEHGFGDADGGFWEVAALSHDGSLLVTGNWGRRVAVWDVGTGQVVSTFAGHGGEGSWHTFSADGASIYTSARDGGVWQWDVRRGDLIRRFPAVGGERISVADGDRMLVSVADPRGAALLDVGPRGEVWDVEACESTYAWTLGTAEGYAAFSEFCAGDESRTFVVDLAERAVILSLPGHQAQHLAMSPDGTRFVRQDGMADPPREMISPPRIRDLTTGELLLELEGVCTWDRFGDPSSEEGCAPYPDVPSVLWNWRFVWSPDSQLVAAVRHGALTPGVMVWDATTGVLRHREAACAATDAIFSPDGSDLVLTCSDWGMPDGAFRLLALSTETWEEVRSADHPPSVEIGVLVLAGYGPSGSTLLAVGEADQGSHLHWIDPKTLEFSHSVLGVHDGGPKSTAMSRDATLVAIGSSDGFVRVWDVSDRQLVHEIYVGATQVQGLTFVDDRHLAVATEFGGLLVYTLDHEELLGIVRGSLTRGFTPTECERYDLEPDCPTPPPSVDGARG
jgi:DNA-binding SARP family transcriptional activator/WD40 repeat protein